MMVDAQSQYTFVEKKTSQNLNKSPTCDMKGTLIKGLRFSSLVWDQYIPAKKSVNQSI